MSALCSLLRCFRVHTLSVREWLLWRASTKLRFINARSLNFRHVLVPTRHFSHSTQPLLLSLRSLVLSFSQKSPRRWIIHFKIARCKRGRHLARLLLPNGNPWIIENFWLVSSYTWESNQWRKSNVYIGSKIKLGQSGYFNRVVQVRYDVKVLGLI